MGEKNKEGDSLGTDLFIAGALSAMVTPALEEAKEKQERIAEEEAFASFSRTSGLVSPAECYDQRKVWFKELASEINACGRALKKLYTAIGLLPMDDPDGFDGQNILPAKWPAFNLSSTNDIFPPGISVREGTANPVEYWINFIIDMSLVRGGASPSLPYNFHRIRQKAETWLKAMRERYWIPNEERWKTWTSLAMQLQHWDESEIETELILKRIPLNCPVNDIVYRTPEEIEWYDRVAERILLLTDVMTNDAGNWTRLLHDEWPDEDFMHARNCMGWEEYLDRL